MNEATLHPFLPFVLPRNAALSGILQVSSMPLTEYGRKKGKTCAKITDNEGMIIVRKWVRNEVVMAKHLFVIRHAKSDWSFDVSDFDRPLNARGFKNAPQMAIRLASHTVQPQQLVSSPAKRAITTAQIFAEHLAVPVSDIQTDNRIYEALPDTLLQVINELSDDYSSVALFGHNPGITLLANYLANGDIYNVPTCGIVHIRFDDIDDWASVSGGTGINAWFVYP